MAITKWSISGSKKSARSQFRASGGAGPIPVDRMRRIDWQTIAADRGVVAAMLETLLPAFMAMRAQVLQLAAPEFNRIVVMWNDVIGDASSDDSAFTQASLAQRLRAQLSASTSVPKRFVVKLTHPSSLSRPPYSLTRRSQQVARLLCGCVRLGISTPTLTVVQRLISSCKVCVSQSPKIDLAIEVDQAHNTFS
jgi:hypothetical protein